jgi:hypothetical protein
MIDIREKTAEEIAFDRLTEINNHSKESVEVAKQNYYTAYFRFWRPEGTTTQAICDAAGNQAYKIFETAGVWIGCIQALDPSWTPPPAPNEFTINPDGTVTIGDPIEVTPE